ncbi:hypothetical protein K438DRAFT_2074062 [Mycena galopus ATCC 62051]|nr:hypothetical protein K438DRAFT_2074062 [Mycena galopus ATCC 62051]
MVPQELIDVILSDVDDDSLPACALASRRFLLPAQRLLFKEMSFPVQQNFRGRGNGASDPITLLVQRASNILSSSPHLIAFVRHLNVGSMYWEEGWEALKVLLCTLRPANIECFSMQGALAGMPRDVYLALTGIFGQSSLQKIALWGWDDIPPSTLTAAFASCQNVVVRCTTLQMATATGAASPTLKQGMNTYLSPVIDGATPLECLALHIRQGAGDLLLQHTTSRLLRGLRELEIFPDALTAAHLCSTTLTHLALHIAWGLESAEFPRFGALRVLTLESTTTGAWSIPMDLVAPSLPTSLPRLEVLNVNPLIKGSKMAQAPALDVALTALAFLREVNLSIYCTASAMWGEVELMHYRNFLKNILLDHPTPFYHSDNVNHILYILSILVNIPLSPLLQALAVSLWDALSLPTLAATGKYTARSYSDYEIYLAILLYELGGHQIPHLSTPPALRITPVQSVDVPGTRIWTDSGKRSPNPLSHPILEEIIGHTSETTHATGFHLSNSFNPGRTDAAARECVVDTECDWRRVREDRDGEARKEDGRNSERRQNVLDVLGDSVVDDQQVLFRTSFGAAWSGFVRGIPASSLREGWTQSTEELIRPWSMGKKEKLTSDLHKVWCTKTQFVIAREAAVRGLLRGWREKEWRKQMALQETTLLKNANVGEVMLTRKPRDPKLDR